MMKTFYDMKLKDKIPQQGEYNVHISLCLDCNYQPDNINTPHVSNAIGWFQLLGDWCLCWECPECGEKWYHHDRELSMYGTYKRLKHAQS